MINKIKDEFNSRTHKLIHYPHITGIIFISLIVLCFIGDLLGDLSGRTAVFYWLFMLPLFFVITLINEKAKELQTGQSISHFVSSSLVYWISASISIMLILFLWHANDLSIKTATLAIHIIVAHTMFLIGTLAGLRFYLIGFFLFLTAAITTQFEGPFGATILLAVPVILFGFYYEKPKTVLGNSD